MKTFFVQESMLCLRFSKKNFCCILQADIWSLGCVVFVYFIYLFVYLFISLVFPGWHLVARLCCVCIFYLFIYLFLLWFPGRHLVAGVHRGGDGNGKAAVHRVGLTGGGNVQGTFSWITIVSWVAESRWQCAIYAIGNNYWKNVRKRIFLDKNKVSCYSGWLLQDAPWGSEGIDWEGPTVHPPLLRTRSGEEGNGRRTVGGSVHSRVSIYYNLNEDCQT